MKTPRAFRFVAIGNIVCGAIIGIWTMVAASGELSAGAGWLMGALLVVQIVIAGSLAYSGWRHLKAPSRRHALTLASNSSVIIWVLCMMLLRPIESAGVSAQVYALIALLMAFLTYRFFLRPAALRMFPDNANRGA